MVMVKIDGDGGGGRDDDDDDDDDGDDGDDGDDAGEDDTSRGPGSRLLLFTRARESPSSTLLLFAILSEQKHQKKTITIPQRGRNLHGFTYVSATF